MDPVYKSLFFKTAIGNVSKLKQCMESLQDTPANLDLVNQMHISAHSLKGETLMMGYTQLGTYCKVIEHYLKRVKESEQPLPGAAYLLLSSAIDKLDAGIHQIKDKNQEPQLQFEIDMLAKQLGVNLDE